MTALYSHRRLYDLAGTVEKALHFLPEPTNATAETLRATVTEGASTEAVVRSNGLR